MSQTQNDIDKDDDEEDEKQSSQQYVCFYSNFS